MTNDSNPQELPPTDAPSNADPVEEKDEDEKDEKDDEDDDDDDEKSEKKDKKDKKKDKPKKVEIEYEAAMPRDEAASYFESLVAGLRSGHLEFRQGERVLVLNPSDPLEIEITAQQKGDKGKVVFEIEWSGQSRLAIVSDAPKPATTESESESDD